jgi:hypothetical protein
MEAENAVAFTEAMAEFMEWHLSLVDPEFLKNWAPGHNRNGIARGFLLPIVESIKGNRSEHSEFTVADRAMIMDAVAALHLRTRHGKGAVLESAVPLAIYPSETDSTNAEQKPKRRNRKRKK